MKGEVLKEICFTRNTRKNRFTKNSALKLPEFWRRKMLREFLQKKIYVLVQIVVTRANSWILDIEGHSNADTASDYYWGIGYTTLLQRSKLVNTFY